MSYLSLLRNTLVITVVMSSSSLVSGLKERGLCINSTHDIPQPPLNVRWHSYDFNVAVLWTGSDYSDICLNTTYRVKVTISCTGDQDLVWEACAGLVHKPGEEYSCHINNQMNYFACFYGVSVIVFNEVGSSNRTTQFEPMYSTTPVPPVNLSVVASDLRQLTVQWKHTETPGFSPTYRVLYQRPYDSKEQVLTCGKAFRCVITGLRPYTWYQVSAQNMLDAVASPSWSPLAGPIAVRTLEEKPTDCPSITTWTYTPSANQRRVDVTIEWQLPDNSTWNGKITGVRLTYYKENSKVPHTLTINDTKCHRVELQGLEWAPYALLIQLCNTVGCCESHDVKWISPRTPSTSSKKTALTTFISAIAVVVILLLLVTLVLTYRFRRKRECCWRLTEIAVDGDEQILVTSEIL